MDWLHDVVSEWELTLSVYNEWFLVWMLVLEKEMAAHSSIFAWRIPWTEETGRLHSMVSQRVRHNWSDLTHNIHWCHWVLKKWQELLDFVFFFFCSSESHGLKKSPSWCCLPYIELKTSQKCLCCLLLIT